MNSSRGTLGLMLALLLISGQSWAQSTKERVARLETQLLELSDKYEELQTRYNELSGTIDKNQGLIDKVEAASVLGQESLGLLRDLMDSIESVRKEQADQLEDVLENKVQLPPLKDATSSLSNRVENLEQSSQSSNNINSTLANRLEKIENQLSSGFFTRTIRDQEALRGELARIRGTVEELELSQEKFAIRLKHFYNDLDFRLRQLVIGSVTDEEVPTEEMDTDNSSPTQLQENPVETVPEQTEPVETIPEQTEPIETITDIEEPSRVNSIGPSENDNNNINPPPPQ